MAARKKPLSDPATVCVVKARCIACKTIRIVSEDDVPKGHHPMCKKCFMPLVAISASLRQSADKP